MCQIGGVSLKLVFHLVSFCTNGRVPQSPIGQPRKNHAKYKLIPEALTFLPGVTLKKTRRGAHRDVVLQLQYLQHTVNTMLVCM